jgi:hypothetical protein
LRRKHTGPLQKVSLYLCTCHCPLVAFSLIVAYKKLQLIFMQASDQIKKKKKNNTINLHAQDTTDLKPSVFFNGLTFPCVTIVKVKANFVSRPR